MEMRLQTQWNITNVDSKNNIVDHVLNEYNNFYQLFSIYM